MTKKYDQVFAIFSIVFLLGLYSQSLEAKTRLSIVNFEDKSADTKCTYRWFSRVSLGQGFKEMLLTKLSGNPRFEILERENINRIYRGEHELINSQNAVKPQKGNFKVAHYTIAGAVTEFELCSSGLGAGVDVGKLFGFGSVKVGAKGARASVAVDLRVIDVETGSILSSVRGEGKSTSSAFDVKGLSRVTDFNMGGFQNSPLGVATREAIENAAEQLLGVIPDRNDPEPTEAVVATQTIPSVQK